MMTMDTVSHSPGSVPFHERAEYKFGVEGEREIDQILKDAGAYVIAQYTRGEENKGPRCYGTGDAFVLPDLDVIHPTGRTRLWVEVKSKSAPTAYRIGGNVLQHGIDLRHYRDYLTVEALTRTEVWIVIREPASHWIGCGHLPEIKVDHERPINNYGSGGMIYWNRDEFKPLGALLSRMTGGEVEAVTTATSTTVNEWRFV